MYKALDSRTGILVAVKVIELEPSNRESVIQEVSIMQRYRHANIVNLEDFFIKQDFLWIAIEYCGGGSVVDLMKAVSRPLSEPECAVVLKSVFWPVRFS